jgi:membrane protease YdiL (CAAX protease family)
LTDAQISDFSAAGLLLAAGLVLGLLPRSRFNLRWLLVAVALVVINNLLLARVYHLVPKLPGGHWNWVGKALALAGTLVIASLPAFGWRRVGLTLSQRAGSLRAALPVALIYCAIFLVIAFLYPADRPTGEDIAFQLTMPGLEEEPFYRGILLFSLDQAFGGRIRLLGVSWGWGPVLSCFAFGLAHAFGYSDGAFTFDPLTMALTALPSFIVVWLRYRTGSLLLPVLLHNFGNAIGMLV